MTYWSNADGLQLRDPGDGIGVVRGQKDGRLLLHELMDAPACFSGFLLEEDPELDQASGGIVLEEPVLTEHVVGTEEQGLAPLAHDNSDLSDGVTGDPFGRLGAKVQRLIDAGQMVDRTAREGGVEFNALCEGLANAELRGGAMTPGKQDEIWRRAFDSMVSGFSVPHTAHRIKAARRRPAR